MQRFMPHLLVPIALAGCHMPSTSGPVPVQGSGAERSRLAGEWSGRYWSDSTGRRGSIRFTLPERSDSGFGEVQIRFSPALRQAQTACSVKSYAGGLR